MVSLSTPLDRLVVDAEKEVDLLALPRSDVESLVRDCYSFLPPPLEIRIEGGTAHIKILKKPPKPHRMRPNFIAAPPSLPSRAISQGPSTS